MATHVAGDTITLTLVLRDTGNAPITTAGDGDFSETVRHASPTGVVTTPTVGPWAHVANGLYTAIISPAVAGVYTGVVDYAGAPPQAFLVDETVTTSLAAGRVRVVAPVDAVAGTATVYQGDDQVAVASRALEWVTTGAGQWPDLTGATITLRAELRINDRVTFTADGSVVAPSGAAKQVRVELSRALTETLAPGQYDAQVIATLAGGAVVTLIEAVLVVKPRRG